MTSYFPSSSSYYTNIPELRILPPSTIIQITKSFIISPKIDVIIPVILIQFCDSFSEQKYRIAPTVPDMNVIGNMMTSNDTIPHVREIMDNVFSWLLVSIIARVFKFQPIAFVFGH